MAEGLEQLKSLGAQKIHEDTHIALRHVQSMLYESFEGMQKIQFLGFVSILEREYKVDLDELKEHANEFFATQNDVVIEQRATYGDKEDSKKSDLKKVVFALVLVGVAVGVFMFKPFLQTESLTKIDAQEEIQESAEQNNSFLVDYNTTYVDSSEVATVEQNNTEAKVETKPKEEPKPLVHSLEIIPTTKVWVGYIDLESGKKKQTVTSKTLELNSSKEYLLTFGHGYISIKVDENTTQFKIPKSVKFIYKDGAIKMINSQEFKRYNKGRLW